MADDFRKKPVPKNDDFRRKATPEERFQSALANETRKARSSLNRVNSEIEEIGMPSLRGGTQMGGDSLRRGLQAAGSLARQGVRRLQGKESLGELVGKREEANRFLEKAERLRKSKPPGQDSLTSFRDTKDAPVFGMKKGGAVKAPTRRGSKSCKMF